MPQPATPEPLPRESGWSDMRAADADRQAVVERLRQAHGKGRLDLTEFDDRTRSAYAARTYAELDRLVSDLPADPASEDSRLPAIAEPDWPTPRHGLMRRILGSAWFFASFVNLVIWAVVSIASGSWFYPWWIWVAGPWGAVLIARWLSQRAGGVR